MSISVLVLQERKQADELIKQLKEITYATIHYQLIKPSNASSNSSIAKKLTSDLEARESSNEALEIEAVELLSPKLARKKRQRNMSFWLMPFGLIAGLSFSQTTGLQTFANFGPWADPLISGLLGMGSGLLGSFVAAASVDSDKKDSIKRLLKRNKEGCWLLLLETAIGIEMPWTIIQGIEPLEIMQLSDL